MRTFRHIMLVAAWLSGLYLVYWAVVWQPAAPPTPVLVAGLGLLLLSALETFALMRHRGAAFALVMPVALLGAATAALVWQHEEKPPLPVADNGEQARSVTIVREQIDPTLLVPAVTEPKPPYFAPGEVVRMSLYELQRLARRQWAAEQPDYRPSPVNVTLEQVGTDRFAIVGQWKAEHTLSLKPTEGVLAMYRKYSGPQRHLSSGFLLRFATPKDVQHMQNDAWYEVTGRLRVDPTTGEESYWDMEVPQRIMTAWLEVENVREVEEPEDKLLRKHSDKPPYHPVPVIYKEAE